MTERTKGTWIEGHPHNNTLKINRIEGYEIQPPVYLTTEEALSFYYALQQRIDSNMLNRPRGVKYE